MSIISDEARGDGTPIASAATHDPVCGMQANPATARAVCMHDGTAVGFCCDGCKGRFLAEPERYAHALDPVCGNSVERIRPGATARHEGQRYWFCSEGCRERFEAETARFAEHAAPSSAPTHALAPPQDSPAVYTCPCHPEVRSDVPADCPECGMALEAQMPAPARTEYVCPMHPAVVRDASGKLPGVRHGSGAEGGAAGRRAEPGAREHAPAARRSLPP